MAGVPCKKQYCIWKQAVDLTLTKIKDFRNEVTKEMPESNYYTTWTCKLERFCSLSARYRYTVSSVQLILLTMISMRVVS